MYLQTDTLAEAGMQIKLNKSLPALLNTAICRERFLLSMTMKHQSVKSCMDIIR